jgi:hypothetical protein
MPTEDGLAHVEHVAAIVFGVVARLFRVTMLD